MNNVLFGWCFADEAVQRANAALLDFRTKIIAKDVTWLRWDMAKDIKDMKDDIKEIKETMVK